MDYKTTYLKDDPKETEELFPELTGLKFSTVSQGQVVFDATNYIAVNKLEDVDYKIFSRSCKSMIKVLADHYNRPTSELFYVAPNNHVWISSELVFLYIAFCNPEMLLYFNNLVGDAISDGVAYSDGFAYSLAESRLPNDVLQEIIKQRSINGNTENNQ